MDRQTRILMPLKGDVEGLVARFKVDNELGTPEFCSCCKRRIGRSWRRHFSLSAS